jgi:HD-GYP domain-containing protein (c-di-GMP phosphodiesterase class II)
VDKLKILLVDDDPALLDSFALRLSLNYDVQTAPDSHEAMIKIRESSPVFDAAVIDMWMNDDPFAGLKLLEQIKSEISSPPECVILTAYGKIENASECMEKGAFGYVEKGQQTTNSLLEQTINRASRFCRLKREQQSKSVLSGMSEALIRIVESHDPFEYRHSHRIALWSVIVGKRMNLKRQQLIDLEIGARLHDIGLALIPEAIVSKPGQKTVEEKRLFREHPVRGYELMKDMPSVSDDILKTILYHHERYDGSGYPQGLKGEDIPFLAMIVHVANEFENSFSPPGNRAIREPERAKLKLIRLMSEGKLDLHVTEHFIHAYEKGEITCIDTMRHSDELFALAKREAAAHNFIEVKKHCDNALNEILQESTYFGAAFCVATGDLFLEYNQYKDAADAYKRADELRPGFAEALYKRAVAFEKQEMWERADWHYALAAKLIPTYIEAHLARAHVLYKGSFLDEAMKIFDRVIILSPENASAYLGKGRIFHDRFSERKAEEDKLQAWSNYEKALSILEEKGIPGDHDHVIKSEIKEALAALT